MDNPAKALEQFVLTHVPLAKAADVAVDLYDGNTLVLSAPLAANINDKGTAFGGSLYNLCVMAGWGMTWIKAQELGLEGEIVVAKGEIDYLRPLKGRLVATVAPPEPEELGHFEQSYRKRGKAVMMQNVVIPDEHGNPCVRFQGKYALVS